jgi:hypothetical protein
MYVCIVLGTSFVVCTCVCLSADAFVHPPLSIVVVHAVHHVGQETRTEQATTCSSDLAGFILASVFRRIPSPKCASARFLNVLVRQVLRRSGKQSGKQSGGRAGGDPFVPWIAFIVVVASSSLPAGCDRSIDPSILTKSRSARLPDEIVRKVRHHSTSRLMWV